MPVTHVETCFVCGRNNPQGLKAKLSVKDGRVFGEFTAQKTHEGPRGLLHGGILSALLDEAMACLINKACGTNAATASLEVRFKKPARLNERLLIQAELLNNDRRIRYAQASIKREDGTLIAHGKAKFLSNFSPA